MTSTDKGLFGAALAAAAVWWWFQQDTPQPPATSPNQPIKAEPSVDAMSLAALAQRDTWDTEASPSRIIGIPFDIAADAVTGPKLLIPGTPGARIRVWEVTLWNDQQQNVQLLDGAVPLMGVLPQLPASVGFILSAGPQPHFELSQGNPLMVATQGQRVSGYMRYSID